MISKDNSQGILFCYFTLSQTIFDHSKQTITLNRRDFCVADNNNVKKLIIFDNINQLITTLTVIIVRVVHFLFQKSEFDF
jgi:hypothetical protein